MSLRDEYSHVPEIIEFNPMAQVKALQAAAKVTDLERTVMLLGRRVTVMEGLLAQALGMTAETLHALLDHGVAELSRTKTSVDLAREAIPCPACGRNVHRSLSRCQVCGAAVSGLDA